MMYRPQSYIDASPEIRAIVCNGCGTSGWKGKLVPDNLYGLDISEECDVHDWMYEEGSTESDKRFADQMLRANLLHKIKNCERCWFIKILMRRAAEGYYEAVSHAGFAAFHKGKEIIQC